MDPQVGSSDESSATAHPLRNPDLKVTFRESHDFVVYVRSQSSLLHLPVSSRDAAVADVISNGVIEEHSILGNHTDVRSQRPLLHLSKDNEVVVIRKYVLCFYHFMLNWTWNYVSMYSYFRYILPIDAYAASLNIIETEEESHNGALPRA